MSSSTRRLIHEVQRAAHISDVDSESADAARLLDFAWTIGLALGVAVFGVLCMQAWTLGWNLGSWATRPLVEVVEVAAPVANEQDGELRVFTSITSVGTSGLAMSRP